MKRRLNIWLMLALVGVASFTGGSSAMATPDSNDSKDLLGRGAVGRYETGPGAFKYDGADLQLALDKATDVAVVHGSMTPGGTVGWHSHPDVVFVTVTEGEMTLYDADDPSCTPYVVHAGEAFIEPAGLVHIARNESTTDRVSWYATHIGVPTGAATSIDQPDPGNCAL
jgi:quercetin dioxygenase-like cupin family protein